MITILSLSITSRGGFFSLRDHSGNSVASIHILNNGKISQIRGRANKPVIAKYEQHIIDFVEKCKFLLPEDNRDCGLYYHEPDKKIYSVRHLPEGAKVNSDLYLVDYTDAVLPKNLKVSGTLYLRWQNCPIVPDSVKAEEISLLWKDSQVYHHPDRKYLHGTAPSELIFCGETHKIELAVWTDEGGEADVAIGEIHSIKQYQSALNKPSGIHNANNNIFKHEMG